MADLFLVQTSKGVKQFDRDDLQRYVDNGKLKPTHSVRRQRDQAKMTVAEALAGEEPPLFAPEPSAAPSRPGSGQEQQQAVSAQQQQDPSPFAPPKADVAGPMHDTVSGLASPTGRAKIVTVLLIVGIVSGALNILDSLLQINLLSGEFTDAEIESNDFRAMVIGFAASAVYFITVVFFARWLLLVNRNAQAMDPNITIRGGWAVGWYFIPIANLFKPYISMKEMYQASNAAMHPVSIWWTLWIINNVLAQISSRMMMRADDIDSYIQANYVFIGSTVVDILLTIAAINVVRVLTKAQEAQFQTALNK